MKRTQWFPASINPVRVGWYDVRCRHRMYGYPEERIWFNGSKWGYSPDTTAPCSFGRSCDSWRGLAKKGGES